MGQQKHIEFYEELEEKISNWLKTPEGKNNKWKDYIKYTPHMFQLICNLSFDQKIDKEIKGEIAPVVAYFTSPFDYIPEEYWGAIGYKDDLVLSVFVLSKLKNAIDQDKIDKYWEEEKDLWNLVEEIKSKADQMIEEKYLTKLKELV